MFGTIFSFEIRRWSRTIGTYVYFAMLFIITFLLGTATAGTWDGVNLVFGKEKVFANAPVIIDLLLTFFGTYIGIIIVVAVVGSAVLKDFTGNTYSLIFTTSLSKFNYLFGRFSASLLVCLFILTAPALGLMASYSMPWVDASRIGSFVFAAYWQNYLYTIVPNVFFAGTVFFAVSLIGRDLFVIWISLIVFFVAFGVSNSFFSTLEHQSLAALLDPYSMNAKQLLTKYWTAYEDNHRLIPFSGVFLYNRIIWLSVSLIVLFIGYKYFSFSASPRTIIIRKKKLSEKNGPAFQKIDLKNGLPAVSRSFVTKAYLNSLWSLSVNECRTLLRNTYFRIILLFGMLLLFLVSVQIGKIYDTATFPLTSQVILFLSGTFQLFVVILTIMFAGELVWRARDNNMSNILDSMPVPNWVYYVSKLFGLWFMQVILLCVILVCGIIIQTFKGYTHYEILLYIRYLFGMRLINLWLFAVLCIFIQTLVNNRYIGYFITAIFYIWNTAFATLVLKNHLFVYGSDPGYIYSEMNGFGHALFPYFVYKFYWAALAICLALLSSLLWARGSENYLKLRWAAAKMTANRPAWILMLVCGLVFVVCGGFIYYNTNIENKFATDFKQEEEAAHYEKRYKKYENIPQPKITSVRLDVDIFPETRSLHTTDTYIIKNKSSQPIDSVHLSIPDAITINELSFGIPAVLLVNDKEVNYRIYKLSKPMQPGDSLAMSFNIDMIPKGFKHSFSGISTPLYNGTFMNNTEFLPYIGYTKESELADNNRRKKHDLPYRPTSHPINDLKSLQNNAFFQDADFIDFEATVSTVPDQYAIAPGYLLKDWTENGRRYFHYKMDSKILNFYAFLSARYTIRKEKWNDVNLEIYYQKGHEYNIDRMFNAMKKALTYYTTQFTPYQHRQVRILEFPRYQTFAQSFPNTIPFSEGIGFIADVSDSSKGNIDYPLQVTAHEVAHQWFAHQVIGADVEGSNMLSESLAQYASIMVVEKEYGEARLNKFLRYELNDYLITRSAEKEKEKPLAFVDEGQAYVLYQKGGYLLHALNKYIGEDSLNHAIKRFVQKYAFHDPPYPTTLDLIAEIRKSTPDSLQYLVTDIFERIAIYNNKITEASMSKTNDNKYKIDFTIDSKKLYSDTSGKEVPVASDDYIEIGLLNKKGDIMLLNKYKLKGGTTSLSIISNSEPDKVMIDPRHLLIDKDLDDNEKKLKNNKLAVK